MLAPSHCRLLEFPEDLERYDPRTTALLYPAEDAAFLDSPDLAQQLKAQLPVRRRAALQAGREWVDKKGRPAKGWESVHASSSVAGDEDMKDATTEEGHGEGESGEFVLKKIIVVESTWQRGQTVCSHPSMQVQCLCVCV